MTQDLQVMKIVSKLTRWTKRQLEEGELSGLCFAVFDAVRWEFLKLSPTFRKNLHEHLIFDEVHGTNTSGDVFLSELDISEEQKKTSYWYEPAPPWLIREFIESIPLDLTESSLVDLGSGKGRVLLVGAQYPFKSITGIELSLTLHETAAENVRGFRSEHQRCFTIEAIQGDATSFKFPQTPLVVSLFNPFGEVVLGKVIENLLASLREQPRECFVAYVNPKHREVLDRNSSFTIFRKTRRYLVYRVLPS